MIIHTTYGNSCTEVNISANAALMIIHTTFGNLCTEQSDISASAALMIIYTTLIISHITLAFMIFHLMQL